MNIDQPPHLAGWLATTETDRIRQSSLLLAAALCLHTVVDPALTYLAVVHFEVALEANPFIKRWLRAGLGSFVAIHLPVYALGGVAIVTLRWLYHTATPREQELLYYLSVIGFSGLLLWGTILVANGLAVLWTGLSGAAL